MIMNVVLLCVIVSMIIVVIILLRVPLHACPGRGGGHFYITLLVDSIPYYHIVSIITTISISCIIVVSIISIAVSIIIIIII